MRRFRHTLMFTFLACTCLALGACGGGSGSPAETYRKAIEAVPNVDHADVQHKTDTGMGSNTSIEVFTDTNDPQQLNQVLNESIQAYLAQTGAGENSSLHFVVVSADSQTLLGPDAVGVTGNDLRSLQEQYRAP